MITPIARGVLNALLFAAPVLAELDHRAHVLGGDVDRHREVGLLDPHTSVGNLRWVVDLARFRFGVHLVDDARRGRDETYVVLALEPLLDDLHVQEPEEAAAKPESQCASDVSGSNMNAASLRFSFSSASRSSVY